MTSSWPLPATAVAFVGGCGAIGCAVMALVTVENALVPYAFMARTRNRYVWPETKPVVMDWVVAVESKMAKTVPQ